MRNVNFGVIVSSEGSECPEGPKGIPSANAAGSCHWQTWQSLSRKG